MGKVEGNPGVLVLKRSVLSSRRPGQDKNPSGRGTSKAGTGSLGSRVLGLGVLGFGR
jgi:hypothetical protein